MLLILLLFLSLAALPILVKLVADLLEKIDNREHGHGFNVHR